MISVLIVEDDPMVAEINKSYINSIEGFKVVSIAKDEAQALNFLEKKPIDLIVLDIFLPTGHGIELLKKIRSKHMESDVIMVTADSNSETIKESLRLGAIDYLIKPFEYERLRKTLENYKNMHSILNRTENIDQSQIDSMTIAQTSQSQIPKGLNEKTLNRIVKFMKMQSKDYFNIEELARDMDLSKVTIRRYVDYLESIGYLIRELDYGSIGRPSHIYKLIN